MRPVAVSQDWSESDTMGTHLIIIIAVIAHEVVLGGDERQKGFECLIVFFE